MSGSLKRERERGEGGLKGRQQLQREALEQEEMVREVSTAMAVAKLAVVANKPSLTPLFSCALRVTRRRFPSRRKK